MDCRKLNEMFNCDGPEWLPDEEYERINKGWKHHEETKELMRQSNKGVSQDCRDAQKKRREENPWPVWNKGLKGSGKGLGVKRVEYRGIEFPSLTKAAEYFGVSISAVSHKCVRL